LLRPDAWLNQLFLYCLALGAKKFGVEVHGLCVMSNHYHLVLTDVDGVLPTFMGWLNSQLGRSIKRLRRWDEVVWEPNVHFSAVELEGQGEVLDKLAYTLLNPVSAGLVDAPEDWPGVLSTLKMLRGGGIAVRRPRVWFKDRLPSSLELSFVPPPHFVNQARYLGALQSLVEDRTRTLREERLRQGKRVLGRRAVRKTPVTGRPATPKRRFGRSPTFSALSREARRRCVKRLRAFRTAYRSAYEAWRSGDRETEFPAGTWWLARCAGVSVAT
jgi:REP element-mobilizing transposase RayT